MSTVYTTQFGDITSIEDLQKLSRAQLVQVFNTQTGKTIVSFKDHGTAVARTWAALTGAINESKKPVRPQAEPITTSNESGAEAPDNTTPSNEETDMAKNGEKNGKAKKAKKEPKAAGERKPRELKFEYDAAKEKTPPREGSRRAKCMAMCQRENGATLEQIMSACEWNREQAIGALRLLHYKHGYGLRQDGSHIHLKER